MYLSVVTIGLRSYIHVPICPVIIDGMSQSCDQRLVELFQLLVTLWVLLGCRHKLSAKENAKRCEELRHKLRTILR